MKKVVPAKNGNFTVWKVVIFLDENGNFTVWKVVIFLDENGNFTVWKTGLPVSISLRYLYNPSICIK